MSCHSAGERRSPRTGAPTFERVAAEPGVTSAALDVALRTPHRTMPNIMLEGDELRDIVAYILSLRPAR
jgi:hypothetical protein